MKKPDREEKRYVIPRWRNSSTVIQSGDARFTQTKTATQTLNTHSRKVALQNKSEEWTANPSIGVALDFVSTAVILGVHEPAEDAALFLLDHRDRISEQALSSARRILGARNAAPSDSTSETSTVTANDLKRQISKLRHSLNEFPVNPLKWSDLARAYTSLGLEKQAEKSMRMALQFSPDHKVILRAAARMHVQFGHPEQALHLLRRNPRTPHDPWLISAEISISQLSGLNPMLVKQGRNMAESKAYSPFHLSELQASVGTLDALNGKPKQGKKLFKAALMDPTSNTIAQAQWISHEKIIYLPEMEENGAALTQSMEAEAMTYYHSGDYTRALQAFSKWIKEEPISDTASMCAAFICGVYGHFDQAVEFMDLVAKQHPSNPMVLNNLAFFQASAGKVREAIAALHRIDLRTPMDPNSLIALLATQGLVAFRRGDTNLGMNLYQESIALAQQLKQKSYESMARLYLARELYLANHESAAMVLDHAIAFAKQHPSTDTSMVIRHVQAVIERTRQNSGQNLYS